MTSLSRRHWLQTAPAALAAGLAVPAVEAQTIGKPPENFRVLGAPVVQAVGPTTLSVAWAVNDTSTAWVEYGETEALGSIAATDGQGLRPLDAVWHRVRVEGLKPATRYYYRTVSVPVAFLGPYDIRRGRPFESRIYGITTPEAAAATTRFAVINDTHERAETVKALFTQLAEAPGDLLFWNGDMFDDIGSERQLAEQLLCPAGLPYAATRPVYFSRGNHDVRGAAARVLGRCLETPGGEYFYTVRQGPVAFIVVDTGEDKEDGHPAYAGLNDFDSYRTRQATWLAETLRSEAVRTAPFRVLVAHIPLYSATDRLAHGGADARAKWHDHLVKGGIDLVITGHTHRHAWMPPDATRPFGQLTGGGPQPDIATIIRGEATAQVLTMRMRRLDGTLIGEYTVPRRS